MSNELLNVKPFLKYEKALQWGEVLNGRIDSIEVHAPFGQQMSCAMVELENGLKGLIYESEFDTHKYRSLVGFIDHTIDFKVLDVQKRGLDPAQYNVFDRENNIVLLSRIQALEEQRNDFWALPDEQMLDRVVEGRVSGFQDKALYIDVSGVTCRMKIQDYEYGWTDSMLKKLPLGAKVVAKIISFNRKKQIIELSRKELLEDPWENVHLHYGVGNFHTGVITNVVPFVGIFIRLRAGIETMAWFPKRMPEGNLIGKTVGVYIQSIKKEERRIKSRITNFPHEVY
ncbi:hypothetical protein ABE82_26960 (plasmid) [Paenibacillus peoriae]|uniref:hypothetical protein n=1 Tax=Paenibacillus peoriae TaxID=59893 RepID=UPI000722CBA5|nr:hypothetical protein [Paenibacillus peoriae]ALS10046.1 hypothetical protein ABE82_26960 [Paenibacillus peoriae]